MSSLDLTDPRIQEALHIKKYSLKYNKQLTKALDRFYSWQKKGISNTLNHKIVGIVAANQCGKSELACAIVACHLIGIYPDWWKGKRFDKAPTIMAAGVDSNHNKNVIQDRLFGTNNKRMVEDIGTGMIPRDVIMMNSLVTQRGDEIVSAKFEHISGGKSELIFRSYSQGRAAAQGIPADVIMIDEQPNDEFFQEALTRTQATKGHVICSFTPLEGKNLMLQNMMDIPPEEGSPEDKFGYKHLSDGITSLVRASWYDASHIIDADPNCIEQAKKDYGYSFEARVYGIPVVGAGRIYPHGFDKITYNPENVNINEAWEHLIGIDFGWTENDPSAGIMVAYDESNDCIYVTDEFKEHTLTDRAFVKQVNFMDPDITVAWPRDGNKASDWKGGGAISDKLREMGLKMLSKPFLNPTQAGIAPNNYLNPGFQEINDRFITNRLKISTECPKLLDEIENYGYGKDINGQSTGKPKNSSIDHACDAFRYAVMSIIQGLGVQRKHTNFWGNDDSLEDDDDYYQAY